MIFSQCFVESVKLTFPPDGANIEIEMSWNIDEDVPDMTGKTVLITGCTSGIGYETASQLLQRNATIIMACRNDTKMQTAQAEFETKHKVPTSRIHKIKVDVSDLDSVRSVPAALQHANITSLHAIVLNAGITQPILSQSKQGVELTFATNVLGHWLLTKLLLPFIRDVPSSRIIAVTSVAHFLTDKLDYEMIRCDGDASPKYSAWSIYCQTKLAGYWLVNGLNEFLQSAHARTVAVTAHPGYANSEMTDPASPKNNGGISSRAFHALVSFGRQSTEQGAWPLTHAASHEPVSRQDFFGPAGLLGLWGPPVRNVRRGRAVDDLAKQKEFWHVCEELSGESYPSQLT